MATLKKNQINQVLFTMVDKTDFATIETSLASNFTVKYCGANHGAVASTTIGDVGSTSVIKKGSGFYKLDLTASQCNFDMLMVRIAHASAATQMLLFELPTYDDSDMYSYLSDMASDIKSAIASLAGSRISGLSDILSKVYVHTTGASDILSKIYTTGVGSYLSGISDILSKVYTQTSDIQSNLASFIGNWTSYASDVASAVWAHGAGASVVNRVSRIVSIASDAHSAAILAASTASDTQSALDSQYTKVYSGINALTSQLLLVKSIASDAHSAAILGASTASDTQSALDSQYTKVYSGVNALTSQLLLVKSLTSDAHSAAVKANSIALLNQSAISDLDSALTSRFSDIHSFMSTTGVGLNASTMSDLRSAVAAGPAATITDADVSNIASAVWVRANGSDIVSKMTALTSRVPKMGATASALSNYYSQLSVMISDVYSLVSDVDSAVAATATASDVASKVWSTGYSNAWGNSTFGSHFFKTAQSGFRATASDMSDLRSAIAEGPTGGVTVSNISDIASRVWSEKLNVYSATASTFASKFALAFSRISDAQSAAILGASHASDAHSLITKVSSQLSLVKSLASDAHSAAAQANSRALVVQSIVSDVQSAIDSQALLTASWFSDIDSALTSRFSDFHSLLSTTMGGSDLYSKITKLASRITVPVATQSKLGVIESYCSDIDSAISSQALLNASWFSDIDSAITSRFSDLHSFMSTTGVGLNNSMMSDLRSAITAGPATANTTSIAKAIWQMSYSLYGSNASSYGSMVRVLKTNIPALVATSDALSKAISTINSHVSTTGGGVTVSNISDIASAVWGQKYIGAGAHNVASTFGSAFRVVTSNLSDTQSALDSQYTKVYSAVQAGGLNASAISDIASAVWAQKWTTHSGASSFGSAFEKLMSNASDAMSAAQQANSRTLVIQSNVSDVDSALSSQYTKVYSQATKTTSMALVIQSMASDAHSAAILGASHASDAYSVALLCRSMISDVESALDSQYTKVYSTIQSSNIRSMMDSVLNSAIVDGDSPTANSIKDRLRTMGWILRNRLKVNDTTGQGLLYKDDGTTSAFKVTAQFVDDGVSTVRKRYE